MKFILGILNSKMINWLYTKSYTDVNIKPTDIEKLPIPNIAKKEQEPIRNLVNKLLETKQKIKDYQFLYKKSNENNNFDREILLSKELKRLKTESKTMESKIDEIVYELYELTNEEIEIIEKNY